MTRARYRNEVISSMSASDITATTTSEGTRALRRYLEKVVLQDSLARVRG